MVVSDRPVFQFNLGSLLRCILIHTKVIAAVKTNTAHRKGVTYSLSGHCFSRHIKNPLSQYV